MYCRPILEYCSPVWFSFHSVRPIEGVLRHFTRIAYTKNFETSATPSYEERLGIFALESMQRRLTLLDLFLCFKIVNDLCDIPSTNFFEFAPAMHFTREHRLKLRRKCTARRSVLRFFSFRVVLQLNSLPAEVIESSTIANFKKRLRKVQFSYCVTRSGVF